MPFHRLLCRPDLAPALLYGALTVFATGCVHAAAAREPHIALLLPLQFALVRRHADAVQAGLSRRRQRRRRKDAPPLRVYPVNDDTLNVLTTYEQALEAGAQLVVGPLTRNGVSALAGERARHRADARAQRARARARRAGAPLPAQPQLEAEARQVAQLALATAAATRFVLSDDTPLVKRIHQAFVEEFTRLGGKIVAEYSLQRRPGQPRRKLRQAADLGVADMVFLALDYRARAHGPAYLGNSLADLRHLAGQSRQAVRSPRSTSPTCASSTCRGCCSPITRR